MSPEPADDPRPGRDSLGMMRRADLWPSFPYLHVKRFLRDSPAAPAHWQTGVMAVAGDTDLAQPTVYEPSSGRPVGTYEDLEGVAGDGWEVD